MNDVVLLEVPKMIIISTRPDRSIISNKNNFLFHYLSLINVSLDGHSNYLRLLIRHHLFNHPSGTAPACQLHWSFTSTFASGAMSR